MARTSHLLKLKKPFGFPSLKGELANRAVAICKKMEKDYKFVALFQVYIRSQRLRIQFLETNGRIFVSLTGCRARPTRNFFTISSSESKSRLTYKSIHGLSILYTTSKHCNHLSVYESCNVPTAIHIQACSLRTLAIYP